MPEKSIISLKRAYDPPARADGARFLVDRLWPRGVTKAKLRVEDWIKSVAPSGPLRKWFNHDVNKWADFQKRYFAELDKQPETWQPLADAVRSGRHITLVYGARDTAHNNAAALRAYLLKKL